MIDKHRQHVANFKHLLKLATFDEYSRIYLIVKPVMTYTCVTAVCVRFSHQGLVVQQSALNSLKMCKPIAPQ